MCWSRHAANGSFSFLALGLHDVIKRLLACSFMDVELQQRAVEYGGLEKMPEVANRNVTAMPPWEKRKSLLLRRFAQKEVKPQLDSFRFISYRLNSIARVKVGLAPDCSSACREEMRTRVRQSQGGFKMRKQAAQSAMPSLHFQHLPHLQKRSERCLFSDTSKKHFLLILRDWFAMPEATFDK